MLIPVAGPRLLTTATVARSLSVVPRTVRLWAECGEIPAIKVGRQWRFDRSALGRWMGVPSDEVLGGVSAQTVVVRMSPPCSGRRSA